MVWQYSRWDSIPFVITLVQLGINLWLAITWETHTLLELLLLGLLCLFLFWYNGVIASHNFVHTPWFTWNLLNRLYAAINSINLGIPFSHYYYQHLNHHQYTNDRKGTDGKTKDQTSTFAYGKDGQAEHVIFYCSLGLLRNDIVLSFREAKHREEGLQAYFEASVLLIGTIGYILISYQYFIYFFLPVFYAGWLLEHLENYYEHFGGIPENRFANSSSYYGWLYNLLFCNEGYHQEHHLRPNVHWLVRPQIRQEFWQLDVTNRVILDFPPLLGFLSTCQQLTPNSEK